GLHRVRVGNVHWDHQRLAAALPDVPCRAGQAPLAPGEQRDLFAARTECRGYCTSDAAACAGHHHYLGCQEHSWIALDRWAGRKVRRSISYPETSGGKRRNTDRTPHSVRRRIVPWGVHVWTVAVMAHRVYGQRRAAKGRRWRSETDG